MPKRVKRPNRSCFKEWKNICVCVCEADVFPAHLEPSVLSDDLGRETGGCLKTVTVTADNNIPSGSHYLCDKFVNIKFFFR